MAFSPASSRSLAGVLVTDLVDSTSLRVRLGDRVADRVFESHERLLRRSAGRFGASFIHWLGDGIQAAFPSASAAMQAAVAIQQANARVGRRPGRIAELAIRVGVGAGEIRMRDAGLAGATLDDTRALCRRADGGEILCRAETIDLIGRRLDLDLLPLPDELARVRWSLPRPVAETLVLPHALEAEPQLPFVGRSAAVERLRHALDEVMAGRPRVVVIRGIAGVGKTRLAARLARESRERGAVVLFGACRSDLAMSNAPMAQAFRAWLDAVEDAATRLGRGAAELVRLVPELVERAPRLGAPTDSDAETERLRLYDAVGEWLVESSLDEPIVLLLDSMHWAGAASFQLLQHVLPMLRHSRVMITVMTRPEDDSCESLLRCAREELGPAAAAIIELTGLDLGELSELLDRLEVGRPHLQDAQILHAVTRGNPLHLNEILRSRGPRTDLPQTVHDAMRVHMERLEAGQRGVLEAAAVLGSEFEARCLAEMTGDQDATLDALDAAVAAGLLREVDRAALRYRFAHDVTRQTVLDGIGAGRTTRLHERAGLAIEAVGGGEDMLADLARHFAAAAPLGRREQAVDYATRAAEQAARRYANESAEAFYRQALELLGPDGDPGRICDLTIGRGEALRRMGDPGHRALLLGVADRACEIGDGRRMASALITAYRGTFSRAMRVDEDYVERLRRAVDLLGAEERATRARLLALIGVETAWSPDREQNQRVMNEAVALAREIGDPDLLAVVLAHRQWTLFHPLAERMADTEELARLARRSANPLLRFDALGNEVFTRIRAGDRPGLDRAMEQLREAASEADQPLVRWMLMTRESALALMEARFDEAEACIEEGRKLGLTTGQPDTEAQYVVQRYFLDLEIQPLASARPLTLGLAQSYQELPPRKSWSNIALRAAEIGLEAAAAPIVEAMQKRGFETLPKDQPWLITLCGFGAAAAAVGNRGAAEQLHALLEGHAAEHANVVFTTLGSVSRYLGLLCRCLGRDDDAEVHLRRAIAANREIGAVTWLARSQLDLVASRLDRGRLDAEARDLLRGAAATAERLGLPAVAWRAQRLAGRG